MGILVSKFLMFLKFKSSPPPTHTQDNLDHQKDLQLEDRISKLPDDLFGSILSDFPIKEVARNSVISHRWRNLWKVTTRLNLDSFNQVDICLASKTELLNYVKWVNWIVDSHEGGKLKEFRIRHALGKQFQGDVDKWVKFAFSKQVQIFYLDVPSYRGRSQNYTLSTELVETFVNHKFNGFKYLKSLSLKQVNLNDEAVEFIMNNSPVLEQLCLEGSVSLSTLRVCGPQCLLKSLEVNCGLKSLEIYDVASLVSLSYSGPLPQNLIIKNVPSLTDFRFAGCMVAALFLLKLNDLLTQFSCSLKSLTLDISYYADFENYKELPKMTALEKLVMHTFCTKPSSSWCPLLTKVCPNLKEFVFQAHSHHNVALPDGNVRTIKDPHPHECLKEVKILGYYGLTRDVAIASYFIQNAPTLKTLVIDPRDQSPIFYRSLPDTKLENDARIRAKKQFKWKVPSKVKLVVL